MRKTITPLVVVGVLAVVAGVLIAGVPRQGASSEVVIDGDLVSTTASTTTSLDLGTTPPSAPVATAVPSTSHVTRVTAAPTTQEPVATQPPTTTPTTTTTPPTTTTTTTPTTTTTTTAPAPAPQPEPTVRGRGSLDVAAANGAAVSGVAAEAADRLRIHGYDVVAINADSLSFSTVYFQQGLSLEAARLAEDLGWTSGDIAPMGQAPMLFTDRSFDLVAVVGSDRV